MKNQAELLAAYEVLYRVVPRERVTRYSGETGRNFIDPGAARAELGKTMGLALDAMGLSKEQFENNPVYMYRENIITAMCENTGLPAPQAQSRMEEIREHFWMETAAPSSRAWRDGLSEREQGIVSLMDAKHAIVKPGLDTTRRRLFVDMDGTLAVFKPVDRLETLYERGYFANLAPIPNVLDAVKTLANSPDVDVYIMSSYLSDSKYALEEKNAWLDRYLPEIPRDRRIFPPCGDNKRDFVPDGIRPADFLLDDYTVNLLAWEPPARGIKVLNGINHTKGTWQSDRIRFDKAPGDIAADVLNVMRGAGRVLDVKPTHGQKDVPAPPEAPKEIEGYRILAESPAAAFGFSPGKENQLALWEAESGESRALSCASSFPAGYYDTMRDKYSLDTDKIWRELEQAGKRDYLNLDGDRNLRDGVIALQSFEFREYRRELLGRTPEGVLDGAYKYVMFDALKCDVMQHICTDEVPRDALENLAETSLGELYEEYLEQEYPSTDVFVENFLLGGPVPEQEPAYPSPEE